MSLAELYPRLSAEELRVAEQNIDRYLHLILRITKRLGSDPEALASLQASVKAEEAGSDKEQA